MSIIQEAYDAMSPLAKAILGARTTPYTDEEFTPLQPVLERDLRVFLKVTLESASSVGATDSFAADLLRYTTWTIGRARAVANMTRNFQQPSKSAPVNPVQAQVQAALAGAYECYTCHLRFTSMFILMDHKRAEHGGSPNSAGTQPTEPAFVPKLNLDLRTVGPNGYFAVEDVEGTRFYRINVVKRPSSIQGKFVWSKYRHRYTRTYLSTNDYVVRELAGDTKRLIGMQRATVQDFPNVYVGECEDDIKIILSDLDAARILYGHKIGACGYCGKKLTDQLSRSRGIGPDCWENKFLLRPTMASS